ncbi:MAG: efflux RND transporter permease subunit [Deltaproteobacteria bacterium]|nr:efflux RND transporter permease subunit [Deltaproteobacteria bacterium]MBW2347608.1 efflux RND transporter permease subunit [Deltaproteobacteria bacterium]
MIEKAIRLPVTVTVGAILIVLFGLISLFRVPVQLTPDVEKPKISVRTIWPGAGPEEVEKEIVIPQEDKLKALEGLVEMESESHDSMGNITLTFQIGTDMEAALLKVSNKLDQVPRYPERAEKPVIVSAGEQRQAIAYVVLGRMKSDPLPIDREKSYAENFIKPRLERVPGVGLVEVYGGRERELQVILKPGALAMYRLSVQDVISALRRENRDTSAGYFDEGKRRYILRVLGEYRRPGDVEAVVIKRVGQTPVRIRDVARVVLGFGDENTIVRQHDEKTLVFKVVQTAGTNVLTVMDHLKKTIKDLNREYLVHRNLELRQVYDSTEYIYASIRRVRQNIFLGGGLAVLVLLVFLRSASSILVVTTAIPISIIGTFLMITLFGRNINVISLAGMSFAIGMVVDNSIVVMENIYRHRQMGESGLQAALRGTREVMGAVVASTLTTIAVFVPVVFVEEEAGQLFRDIAIAIASAVFLSLLVSVSVIPSMAARTLKVKKRGGRSPGILERLGTAISGLITGTVSWVVGRMWRRLVTAAFLTGLAAWLTVGLVPDAEYLPEGNRNFVFAMLFPPPGYNNEQLGRIGDTVASALRPYWKAGKGEGDAARLEGPPMDNFFFVARERNVFMGCNSKDPQRVRELIPILRRALSPIPGAYSVVQQGSLFARGIGEGRSIDIEITGPDLERLIRLGGEIFGRARRLIAGSQIRPIPSLDLGNPEIRVVPDREKASRVGLDASDIGTTLDVLLDGAKVDDYLFEGEQIDLVLKGEDQGHSRTQDFDQVMIQTPLAGLVPLNAVAELDLVSGPSQINHIEQQRAIVVRVIPPATLSMEKAMKIVRSEIVGPIRERGDLGGAYNIRITGTADDLTRTTEALRWNFLLAVFITFLLMSALFENFFYPLVILFSVPLAAAGGFLGLWLVNTYVADQPMDILTMLGFVILVGIVVNNAILIVHQSLNFIREQGMDPKTAIVEAVRIRVRPIYMSTTTSIFGMVPLVLYPGAGSELYRGLGSVVIGGLALSTVFTLFLIPALLSMVYAVGSAASRVSRFNHGRDRETV